MVSVCFEYKYSLNVDKNKKNLQIKKCIKNDFVKVKMAELKVKTTDLVYAYFDSFVNSNIENVGKVVDGTITAIDKKKGFIIVDAGLKSEGIIPIKEFFKKDENKEFHIGDIVKVYVMGVDSNNNYILSRENAIKEESRLRVKQAFENDEIIEGIPFAKVKSGLSVDFDGFIAFLPGSQISDGNITDISDLVGKKQQFKVIQFDDKNAVVSRKSVLNESYKEAKEAFYATASEGMEIEGKIRNITDYGAFIDLGFGVDALLHTTDIVWGKIGHPSEVLSVGETVKAKIIKLDKANDKIAVSMKVLTENSWLKLVKDIEVGQKIKGKITNIEKYGIFVEIAAGVEGMIHVSELVWGGNGNDKLKEYKEGEEVEAIVLDIDGDKQRVSLSVRRLFRNPLKEFAESHQINEQIDGVVSRVTDYGMFVTVGEIEGFVSLENIVWFGNINISEYYKEGDSVKVVFLAIDDKQTKISFGIKQLTENPFEKYKDLFVVGNNVTCEVCRIKPDKMEVKIVDGVYSSIKKTNLSREKLDQRIDRFTIGDKIDAKITAFDLSAKKLILSIKDLEEEEYKKIIEKYGSDNTGASLAGVLGVAMDKFNEKNTK